MRWSPLVAPGGRVLDLACGQGRHARFFAGRGHDVDACDRDPASLASLSGVKGVRTTRADLEDGSPWPYPEGVFAAIVVTNYLYRPLFPRLAAALAPAGVLIYETFAAGNERYGKPSNPSFLLKRDELLEAFGRDLVVVAFEQGRVRRDNPAMIQRLCAVRGDSVEADLEPREVPDSVKILG